MSSNHVYRMVERPMVTAKHDKITACKALACHKEAWADWLTCDETHAKHEFVIFKAESSAYFNTVAMAAQLRKT